MDIAQLGYKIDSSQLAQGNRELDKTEKAAGRAETATGKLERQANKMGKAWGVFIGLATSAVILRLARSLTDAAAAAGAFQQSMAEVSTLLDDTSGIEKTSREVRELTKQFGGDAQVQAKALYQIISAGATDSAEAMDILTVSNKLAIGGVTDVATAADGLTSIMNAYGEAAGSATDVSDSLFVAMRGGKTTIGELSSQIGMVAPIAATAQVSLDELTAAIAAVTTGGVQTSVAVTSLRATLASIVKPSSEAVKISKALGIEFNLAGLKAKGLSGFLEDVTEKTGGSEAVMAKLFGGVESLGAVFALTGGQAETFSDLLDKQAEKAGQTEIAYAKMSDTGVQKYARLKAVARDALIEIGNRLLDNGDAVDNLTEAISNPQLINSLVQVAEEIGNMAVQATVAIKEVSKLIGFLDRAGDVFLGLQGQADAFGRMTNAAIRLDLSKFEEARKDYMDAASRIERGAAGNPFANVVGSSSTSSAKPDTFGLSAPNAAALALADAAGARAKAAEAAAEAALASGGGGGGRSKKSEAKRQAEEAIRAAKQAREELERQIQAVADARDGFDALAAQLAGPMAQANYQFAVDQEKLNQLAKDGEVSTDRLVEAQANLRAEHEKNVAAIQAQMTPAQQMIADMEFELALLGMTNIEREKAIALRYANVDAMSAEGQQISKLVEQTQRALEADRFWQETQSSMSDALFDFATSAKSAEDALGDFIDAIFESSIRAASDYFSEAITNMFKGMGGSGSSGGGGGGSGGGWGDFASWISGFFGGGRSLGGDVRGDRMYQVGERNMPELLNMGGRQMLIPGDRGRVEPIGNGSNGPSSLTINQTNIFDRNNSQATPEQIALRTGDASRKAFARTGR